jgi:hypothetical protein
MKGMYFFDMAKTFFFEENAVFDWQGNRIVCRDGAIIDEATGQPVTCDKYTMNYTYKRIN